MTIPFAERLNQLFEFSYPVGRGCYTSTEIIAMLGSEGQIISAPYMSQLRSGNRINPSEQTMSALAHVFRVPVGFFTDDGTYLTVLRELEVIYRARLSLAREKLPSSTY